MFRSLTSRLILSHILPFIVIIPLIGVALVYFLETQFLLPQLSVQLTLDARILAEILRYQPELLDDPEFVKTIFEQYALSVGGDLMLLNPSGSPMDFSNRNPLGELLAPPELELIQEGQVVTRMNTGAFRPIDTIDVLAPVLGANQQVLGIVRLSYNFDSVLERLLQLRSWIIWVLVLGLAVGVAMGAFFAITISRPIRQATQAVNTLAFGESGERVPVRNPEEIKQLAVAVNSLVDRLQSLEISRKQLLANLVHELGRPLGALKVAIQALKRGADQEPVLRSDLLDGMDEETTRLQRLLDDLNGLYDQVLGDLELEKRPLDLAEWLPKVLSPWHEQARQKNIEWSVIISPQLPPLHADPLRLGQAIGNLASNAIKYTPPNGAVQFSAIYESQEVRLIFQDNGPGIPQAEQENIFLPFYQVREGKKINEGMGLGLSIAHEIVTAHGGRLVMTGQPGQGSTFIISLPILQGEPHA